MIRKTIPLDTGLRLGPEDHLEDIRRAHAEVIKIVIILQHSGQCPGVQNEVDHVRGSASLK